MRNYEKKLLCYDGLENAGLIADFVPKIALGGERDEKGKQVSTG